MSKNELGWPGRPMTIRYSFDKQSFKEVFGDASKGSDLDRLSELEKEYLESLAEIHSTKINALDENAEYDIIPKQYFEYKKPLNFSIENWIIPPSTPREITRVPIDENWNEGYAFDIFIQDPKIVENISEKTEQFCIHLQLNGSYIPTPIFRFIPKSQSGQRGYQRSIIARPHSAGISNPENVKSISKRLREYSTYSLPSSNPWYPFRSKFVSRETFTQIRNNKGYNDFWFGSSQLLSCSEVLNFLALFDRKIFKIIRCDTHSDFKKSLLKYFDQNNWFDVFFIQWMFDSLTPKAKQKELLEVISNYFNGTPNPELDSIRRKFYESKKLLDHYKKSKGTSSEEYNKAKKSYVHNIEHRKKIFDNHKKQYLESNFEDPEHYSQDIHCAEFKIHSSQKYWKPVLLGFFLISEIQREETESVPNKHLENLHRNLIHNDPAWTPAHLISTISFIKRYSKFVLDKEIIFHNE